MRHFLAAAALTLGYATAAAAAPVQWTVGSGGNGHWYEFIIPTTPINAVDAEAAAEASTFNGQSGYLATITTAAEQSFLNTLWPGPGTLSGQFGGWSFFLIGISDRVTEGTFEYIGGPEDGLGLTYTNWSAGEPNDTSNAEDYAVAWWQDSALGLWNDTSTGPYGGYVVEFSAAPVPLPAGLPMLLAGLGAFGVMRRRAKT